VVEIMRRLAKEKGSAILLVTHDNRILDVADRLINMEDGRLSSYDDVAGSPLAQTAGIAH
jgi:putative ABC transport system ATP-binding protein